MGSVPILQSGTRTAKKGKNEILGSKRKTVFVFSGTKTGISNRRNPGNMDAKMVCGLPGTRMDKKRRKVFIGMIVFMKVYSPHGGRMARNMCKGPLRIGAKMVCGPPGLSEGKN